LIYFKKNETYDILIIDKMKFNDLNSDILHKIFEEIVVQNYNEIAIFEQKYIEFIKKQGYYDIDFREIPDNDEIYDYQYNVVDDWISDYIYDQLTQDKINKIICDYGINKALVLIHDFYKIGCGDNSDEICMLMESEIYQFDREIVELILKDVIKFGTNWRNNSN
jgi:hypothetical protein